METNAKAASPDYKKMYYTLLDAVEKAMDILEEGTLNCEDIYIESTELAEMLNSPSIEEYRHKNPGKKKHIL